ncbi:MAG: hypothetical protein OHK0039_15930 [Bacteroidia bacterium]
MVPVAFVVGWMLSERRRKRAFGKQPAPPRSFLAGFLALFLLWGGLAFRLNAANASLLAGKMGAMFLPELPISAPLALILLTASIGGLLGGFATLSGNLLGEAIKS